MARAISAERPLPASSGPRAISGAPAHSPSLDWAIALFSCINVFGLFLDGWAHNHGYVDDTFFTPWHALLYSAILASGALLIVTHFRNVSRGYRWRQALPAGYGISLVGFFAFAAAGFGDLIWHETFGFEESLEALLSPAHLLLACTGLLIISGPLRAAWRRDCDPSWRGLLPVILTTTCIVSVITFFTTFAAVTSELDALTGRRPGEHTLLDIYGIVAYVVHGNIMLAAVFFLARRWHLPIGTFTLMFAINALLNTWLHIRLPGEFIFAIGAGAAGLLADIWLHRRGLAPSRATRAFAFVLPFVYSLAALALTSILGHHVWGSGGLWWEIHMWLGVPLLAGVCGYGLNLLIDPPVSPGV